MTAIDRHDGLSVSAWMTEAARRALLIRDGLEAVADWQAEQGAFSGPEIADARARVAEQLRVTRLATGGST